MKRKQFRPNSEWVRYRDETWIPCRKRIYLYWYKFLKHAEESSEHKVDWKKYDEWGGKETVMNMRFDDWWELHWKDCFGIDKELGRARYIVTKRHKADGVRYALLVYENLHRGSTLDIAIAINKKESRGRGMYISIAGAEEILKESSNKRMKKEGFTRKRVRDDSNWTTGHVIEKQDNFTMDDDYYITGGHNHLLTQLKTKKIQAMIRRYKKQAFLHLESVSIGEF